MNQKLVRSSIFIVCSILLVSASFFTYSFLTARAEVMSTTNIELKDKLTKLKEQQSSLKTEKIKLDKQFNEVQQKLDKIIK